MFFPFSPYKPNIILTYTLLLEQSGVGVVYRQGRAALNPEGRYRRYRGYIGIMEEKMETTIGLRFRNSLWLRNFFIPTHILVNSVEKTSAVHPKR